VSARVDFFGATRTVLNDEWDWHLENLEIKGFTIMENVLSSRECEIISDKMDRLNQAQIEHFGEARLHELGDYGTIRDMFLNEPYFRELAMHPTVMEIVQRVIGSTAILHLQNGLCLESDRTIYQTLFHRDFARDFICEKVLFLNAMFVIDEFNAKTGGTNIVPFTHRIAKFPSELYLEENAFQVEAKAGSVFFFDGLLLHKSGNNRSGKTRRAINHGYTRPFLKQQMDYALLLKDKLDPNSKMAQLFGLWSVPPKSVDEYRVDPDKRSYRKGQG